MRIGKLLVLSTVIIAIMLGGCGQKSKTSAPQEWAFQTQKIWEINQVGEDSLLRPAEPRVADDGNLYFHDFGRHLSYILDADGKLVNTFAGRGTGEGEVQFYINCFTAGDYVVICDMDKLHFFTGQGQFVKAVPNNLFVSFPLAFKDENEYWVAPGALGDAPGSLAVVTYVNLTTGEEKAVHEFARTDAESKPTGGALVIGLTPQIKMAYDPQTDRAYFGKNSDTLIYRLAGDGGVTDSFSFSGVQYPVSDTDKQNHFAKFDIPEEAMTSIVKSLPDRMTYYNRIQVINGLIYLIGTRKIGDDQTAQDVNIYSPDGRHLYFGRIEVEDGWHLASPDNLQLADGFIYAVQENDEGNKKIVKYQIALPKS